MPIFGKTGIFVTFYLKFDAKQSFVDEPLAGSRREFHKLGRSLPIFCAVKFHQRVKIEQQADLVYLTDRWVAGKKARNFNVFQGVGVFIAWSVRHNPQYGNIRYNGGKQSAASLTLFL